MATATNNADSTGNAAAPLVAPDLPPAADTTGNVTSVAPEVDTTGKPSLPAPALKHPASAVLKTSVLAPRKTVVRDSAADSVARAAQRDSLLNLERRRGDRYLPDQSSAEEQGAMVTEDEIFRADPVIWYDIAKVKRFTAGSRCGITGSGNRLLHYGNTAPIDRRYLGTGLLFRRTTDPVTGDDASLSTEYGAIHFPGDGTIHFIPRSAGLISPEIALAWETGVFDGNILTVRFSRPVTRSLTVNIFSNYRYFKDMTFNHDAGNIYQAFSALASDSSRISNHGYNPLVNEYFCGADASWASRGAKVFFRVKYGDLADEAPINRKPSELYPDQMRIEHYPLTFEGGAATASHGRWFMNAEARYATDFQRRIFADTTNGTRTGSTAFSTADLEGGLMAGMRLAAGDSLSLQCIARHREMNSSDTVETAVFDARPELVWNKPFDLPLVSGSATLRAGYFIHPSGSPEIDPYPLLSGSIRSNIRGYDLSLYAQRDVIDYLPVIDSTAITPAFYDAFFRLGVEANRDWRLAGLLLGYQHCSGIDSAALGRAWLSGMAPYAQPRSTFIIAPRFGRWNGFTITSRLMLSDSRPIVKLQSGISALAFPKLTGEAIDLRLGLDYWSRRDSLRFAGDTTWSRPVVDLNFAISVHIRSFRLMYKVDNLLNRNFSYIPGWTAPGLVFRWGFSWLIQR